MWKSGLASGIGPRSGRWKENEKLLVLFPGVGYSTARPLLYYAKRMGQEKGYEVLELEYRRMPEHPFDNLKETAKTVCACAEAWAEHVDWEKYDKIAFVSKSVGTVAAGFLTRRLAETGGCVQIVNLFLTPIEPTLKYLTEAKTAQKWVRPRSSFPAQRISGWSRDC